MPDGESVRAQICVAFLGRVIQAPTQTSRIGSDLFTLIIMKPVTLILLLGLALETSSQAQVVNYPLRLQRQRWFGQLSADPYPVTYRFGAQVVGAGLSAGEVRAGGTTNQLSLTTLYGASALTFGTNFPAWSESATNLDGGLADFNQCYPVGSYTMFYRGTLGVSYSRTINLALANDFSVQHPVFTNLTPLIPLRTNMTFGWPVFSASTSDYTRFTLLEGRIGNNYSNLLQTIINQGVDAVTNDLKVVAIERKLLPTQNQVTVTNLSPQLDHLALLEFARFSSNGNDTLYDVTSISANATFFFSLKILSDPSSQVVELEDPAYFTVLAVGTQPLSYQWRHAGTNLPAATNPLLTLYPVRLEDAGPYEVVVTNMTGAVTSAPAVLTITNFGPSQIILDEYLLTSDGHPRFRVSGDATNFVIETTASLGIPTWTSVGTVPAPNGVAYFEDTNSVALPHRFYRARLP